MYSADLAHVHDQGFGAFAAAVAPEIIALLRAHGIRRGLIVEFGCGSGPLARRLTARGYDVYGFDVSRSMIQLARRNAPRAEFRVASLSSVSIPSCQAIVGVGEVVNYVPRGLAALERFFRRAYRALRPGGLLLFDFMASARGRTYSAKATKGKDWEMVARASFNGRTGILTRRLVLHRSLANGRRKSAEIHRVRILDRSEMRAALIRSGFSVKMSRCVGRYRLLSGDWAVIAVKTQSGTPLQAGPPRAFG